MPFLLDTNVLSELRKGRKADTKVREWASTHTEDIHYISVLTIGEIRKGIQILHRRTPEQVPVFSAWLETLLNHYHDQILGIDQQIAEAWGDLEARQSLPVIDGLLAATALVYGLTVVTRNTQDFQETGVSMINPWVAG